MQYASSLGGGDGGLHTVSHPHLVPTHHLAAPGLCPCVADKWAEINLDLNELTLNVLARGVHSVITILASTITNNYLMTNQQN